MNKIRSNSFIPDGSTSTICYIRHKVAMDSPTATGRQYRANTTNSSSLVRCKAVSRRSSATATRPQEWPWLIPYQVRLAHAFRDSGCSQETFRTFWPPATAHCLLTAFSTASWPFSRVLMMADRQPTVKRLCCPIFSSAIPEFQICALHQQQA